MNDFNKQLMNSLALSLTRLGCSLTLTEFFESFIYTALNTSDSVSILINTEREVSPALLDNEAVLKRFIEVSKLIEVSRNFKEFETRVEIKAVNFNKVIKAIAKVPKK